MALDRTLTLWLARQTAAGTPDVLSPVLDPGLRWLGHEPEHVAAKLRKHLQDQLWRPGGEAVFEQLPAVRVEVAEPLTITLPARRDGMPRLSLEVGVTLVQAPVEGPAAVLAVAPSLGLSWAGTTPETAMAGLREAVRLDLLARDPPLDGAAIATLAASSAATLSVVATPVALSLPTFSEMREHEKKGAVKAGDFLQPLAPGEAWHMNAAVDAVVAVLQSQRSVVLVGPRGVGKSAIIREIVRAHWAAATGGKGVRLLEAHAPTFLVKLLANGSWQDDLAKLCARLGETGDWLYITALPELFEVGRYEGNNTSCGEFIRPWLGRGELRLVSECTAEEIAAIDARYPGALNGVVRVEVPEPTDRLEAILGAWNARQNSPFTPDALHDALRLHRRFAPYSGFPGRILRFLGAMLLEEARGDGLAVQLDRDAVYRSFCAQTGLLRPLIDPRAPLPYADIAGFFEQRVYGQAAAGAAVTAAIASIKADVSPWGKPLASLLLVGPTGVGKTETARALAEFLFGSADRMIRFDMSEFQTPGSVLRLIEGADGEGLLTSAVRRQPFCVLLLDELEKAHPAVLDLLLQVLGEGRLTDGRGRLTDFCACVVLMTSNVGAVDARKNAAGFGGPGVALEAAARAASEKAARYRDAVKGWLRPEMLNRIDHILPFDALGPDAIGRVLDRELDALRRRPGLRDVPMTLSQGARGVLAAAGYDPAWGARQLQRAVQDQLVAPLARGLHDGRNAPPVVTVEVSRADGLTVEVAREASRAPIYHLDGVYNRTVGLRGRCRRVLDGPVYAEMEARLASEERAERHRVRPVGKGGLAALATAMGGMRSELATLRANIADFELDVGVRALMETPGPETTPSPAVAALRTTLDDLEARFWRLARALARLMIPDIGELVVGVYGPVDSVPLREQVALYQRVAERCGATVEVARVLPVVGQNNSFTAVFPLRTVGAKPDLKAPPLGVELVVVGPAAAYLFQQEAGVHAFAQGWVGPGQLGGPLAREARLSVHTWIGTYAKFVDVRPADLNRKLRFEGVPHRQIANDKVQSATNRLRIASFAELEGHLQRLFDAKLFDELTG